MIRRRDAGFGGLFRIIVEQQVSVPSARAILGRIDACVDRNDPEAVLSCGAAGLRSLGLSTPKARYVLALAEATSSGAFDFDDLAGQGNSVAIDRLTSLLGVGPWSAAIYLLFCEGRVDVWPYGDVALRAAYSAALSAAQGSAVSIDQAALDARAGDWMPHRGLAAHILWTFYAHLKGRAPI